MIKLRQEVAVGSAHSKLILVGEHSVVYDKPAIALPFPMVEVKSIVEGTSGTIKIKSDYYNGPLSNIPDKMQGIAACIKATLDVLQMPMKGFRIGLNSTIPIGRGLGSSAAIAIAIVRSLFAFYGQDLTKSQLLKLVHVAETYAHGNPSGIDMEAACSDDPIWFEKNKQTQKVKIGAPFDFVVADTGRIGDTHAAVNSIKKKYQQNSNETQQSLDKLGGFTTQANDALYNGDKMSLGSILSDAQIELTTLGVSDEGINKLVAGAQKAGALGAKLTGGGRGGCIIALAHNIEHAKQVAKELTNIGAHNTWYFTLRQTL